MAAVLASLANLIGAQPDGLTLVLTLLAGYPLGFVYRHFLYGKTPWAQHVYFIVCGFVLGYLNFGLDVLHSAINVLLIYGVILTCGGTKLSIFLAFAINMGYLHVGYCTRVDPVGGGGSGGSGGRGHTWTMPHCVLALRLTGVLLDIYDLRQPTATYLCVGYYSVMTTTVYTVTWTTPQCVLTLRLIGLIYDIYDGRKKPEKLTLEQKDTALEKIPSLLEIAGHTYFYGGFLVGPQFPMRRYQDFVSGLYSDPVTGSKPASVSPALKRLSAGLFYTLVFQLGSLYLPDSYLLSSDFEKSGLPTKCFLITLWGKITLYKYLAAWLITEGTCILTGLTYNGKDENGNNLWDSCANIKIRNYESASSCQDIISAFNINTNRWMGKYIFKRLKFLGNKDFSQAVTLFFLAIWHGLYSGYFMNFFLEFPIIKFERDVESILRKIPSIHAVTQSQMLAPFLWVLRRLYSQFALSYALVSFNFLVFNAWGWVYWQVYYIGHIVFCGWLVIYPLIRMSIHHPKDRKHQNGNAESLGPSTVNAKKEL